jgi:LysR family transcriptional regulator, low CO2-responsive transcriptional regulator
MDCCMSTTRFPDPGSTDDATLRRLRMFLAVVDAGGVGEAARHLGISQPAVSTQIKRLEADLGVSLFRRSGRRLAASEQGREIALVLRRGFGELALTLNAVRDIARSRSAPLRFGFSAPQIALDAAEVFRRADPRTALELRAANSADLFAALDAYELDVIMIGLRGPKPPYHCQFYRRQSIAVIVPRSHPFAVRSSVDLQDLAAEPIVLRERGSFTRALLTEAFEAAGLDPRVAFEVASREAVAEAVRRGFGIGPVLDREAPRTNDLCVVPVEGGRIVGDDYLVCHASALLYGPVRRFFAANAPAEPSETGDAGRSPH